MPEEIKTHITGVVFQIPTKKGDKVGAGDPVIVLEHLAAAARWVTTREVSSADVIAVMEDKHRGLILDVTDDYDPGDRDLHTILEPKIRELVERLESAHTASAK